MRYLLSVLVVFGVFFLLGFSYISFQERENRNHFQTPPPDMVFVSGNGTVPSFYMGVTEETNLNYNIYLNWLDTVYSTYKGVKEWATPKSKEWDSITYLNDPQYNEYFTHPAYAYYPVVGVSWLQAVEYLQWKGDRLNEAILYEIDWFNEDKITEIDEDDNFNLESYLNYQYYADLKQKQLPQSEMLVDPRIAYNTKKEFMREFSNGVFFPTMRLPTEAEWEFIEANNNTTNNISLNKEYPFGKSYYLFKWDEAFKWGLSSKKNETTPNNSIAMQQQAASSPNNSWGIFNMENKVNEWLMDEYNEGKNNTPSEALVNSGFRVMLPNENRDADGYLMGKDRFAKFKFVYYDFFPTGKGIPYQRYSPLQEKYLSSPYTKVYVDIDTNNIDTIKYQVNTHTNFYNRKDTFFKRYYIKSPKGSYPSLLNLTLDSNGFYYYKNETFLRKDKIIADFNFPKMRVVRNGRNREAVLENTSSQTTGFRAVMLHSGYPLTNKKYKVNWD